MNAGEIQGLLDAHDTLLAACLENRLALGNFLAAYGDFPDGIGLGTDAAADTRKILPLFTKRIEFHRQVASVLAGLRRTPENALAEELRVFLQRGIMQRLQALVSKYPEFTADRNSTLSVP